MISVDTNCKQIVISGNIDVGSCCACDTCISGIEFHKPQYTLYLCQNVGCNHYVCKEHLQLCGFCEGCCLEENHRHEYYLTSERIMRFFKEG